MTAPHIFRPQSKVAQWQTLYEYVKSLDDDATFTLDEVVELIRDAHGVVLTEERARQVIGTMNRKVAIDGVRVLAIGHGGLYAKGSPSEKLAVATDGYSARLRNMVQEAKRAGLSVLKDPNASDAERHAAGESINHYDALAKETRKTRKAQLKLRPELPTFRRHPVTGEPYDPNAD